MGDSPFSKNVRDAVLERQNGFCDCCGIPLKPYYQQGVVGQIHHRKPQCKDGTADIRNAVALCPTCHSKIHEYIEKYPNRGYEYHKERWMSSVMFKRFM